jgi:hypothetical protein
MVFWAIGTLDRGRRWPLIVSLEPPYKSASIDTPHTTTEAAYIAKLVWSSVGDLYCL